MKEKRTDLNGIILVSYGENVKSSRIYYLLKKLVNINRDVIIQENLERNVLRNRNSSVSMGEIFRYQIQKQIIIMLRLS